MRAQRRGWILGGLIVIAVAVRLGIMMVALEGGRTWSIATIPLLVGCVLLGVGLRADLGREVK